MWLVADILHHNGHCFCDFCMCQFTDRQAYFGERVAVGEKAASERVFFISWHARVGAILQWRLIYVRGQLACTSHKLRRLAGSFHLVTARTLRQIHAVL